MLRVKPVRARRDDGVVECVANNGVSQPDTAPASIHVYTADNGHSSLMDRLHRSSSSSERSHVTPSHDQT